ncbi:MULTISPECIES: TRAP transporter small permease [Colwellia]|uniref:TRAP transporter small permease protein n=1 Tax=Colwellia psychrerythraea (strain 34H / ATCC BAA-681) TaxID=167879 RepID=Q47UG9_COLP3|nr:MULTISPECIES: TRAP transporter small permease [Colwellia]AAZ25116.1 C4-dicarboxylate transporter family protein, DctQ subunit [Colwellia psychrerythraea 34H]PKH85999.1 TRAP transporter small permease [Colwellia sp. Bg11-28]
MKKIFITISKTTELIEQYIVCYSILLMMVNSTANAIGRYAFGKSLFFAEELNQFLIVTITFVGFAYAVRKGRNIRMTAVYDSLGYYAKKVITTLISITTGLLMFYLAYKAIFYVIELKDLNRLSPALQFPVYIIYSIIPLGLGIAGLQYLIAFFLNITHKEIYISREVVEKGEPS